MRTYTGKTRYRLRGFFRKVLVLQVEEQFDGIRYPHFYRQTWTEWRDATFDDLQKSDEIDRAGRKNRVREAWRKTDA